ncbi:MAG: CBS domain-containing protein [Bdellovibrionota bacterium]
MKQMPKIDKFMTPMPHTIGMDIPIKKALEIMREHGIRHLPVQEGGKLVGVLTDRDIKLAASFQGASELIVEDVMTPDPFTTHPEASLDYVVSQMAEHKYGCAVVQQENKKIVGIFTATDGMRVFAEILTKNYQPTF